MKRIDLIRWALTMTDEATDRLVADVRSAPLTQPTSRGGNHAMWIIGHLAYIEGTIGQTFFGEPNPVEHWAPLFAPGSEPKTDPAEYPPFEEVLKSYRALRAKNLKLLDELGEAGLDRAPKNVPPGFEAHMQTFGQTYLLIALHNMVHYGQIADVRRAAGIKPLM